MTEDRGWARLPRLFRIVAAPFLALLPFLLGGCLYTSHHFNSGRVLEPGNTSVTVGYGKMTLRERDCPDVPGGYAGLDSTRSRCIRYRFGAEGQFQDTVPSHLEEISLPRLSLGYRLGVRGAWGPFTGVELGWHLEAPTTPASAEFDLKFGLPAPRGLGLFHSLSGGWIVGMWADNSFFGEYALSRPFGKGSDAHALYASYRLTRLATPPGEVFGDGNRVYEFHRNPRWAHQASLGFHATMPDLFILPDFFSPQITVTTPWVRTFEDDPPELPFLYNFNIGFGWRF
jgi:hypothetical protein